MNGMSDLVHHLARFASALRGRGVGVSLSDEADGLAALTLIDLGDRDEVRRALRTALKIRPRDVAAGKLNPNRIDERTLARYLDEPDLPDVDLFLRSSGEQRTSNFMLWQSAYAEMVFLDTLWPDFDRRDLWRAIEIYAERDRRFGGAIPNAVV